MFICYRHIQEIRFYWFSILSRSVPMKTHWMWWGMCPLRPLHQNLSDFLGEKEDLYPRRLLRSSRPQEICQPPQQGFFSVHAQLQLLGKIVRLLWNYIVIWLGTCTKLVVRLENHIASGYFQSLSWELCTAFNLLGIKNSCLMSYVFTIWHKFRPLGISEIVT